MLETCKGCGAIHKEEWPKGKTAYRCMDPETVNRGRVIEVSREKDPSLFRPAWCPRKGKEE